MSKSPVLLCALLLASASSAQTFVSDGSVNCEKGFPRTTASVPRNALLLAHDAQAKATYPWLDMKLVTQRVNELLGSYGFDLIKAQEFSYATYAGMSAEAYDHAFNFRNNSYLMRLMTLGGSPAGGTESCTLAEGVPGYRKAKTCYNDMHVKLEAAGVDMAVDSAKVAQTDSADRHRAALATLIVHEFVHAVHDRMLAETVGGSADNKEGCRAEFTAEWAKARSTAMHQTLGICAGARHQSTGLLAAGGVLKGNPCSETAFTGPQTATMERCWFDKDLPASAYKNLSAGPLSGAKCQGATLGAFLKLPQAPLIASYLAKRAGGTCFDACYYKAAEAKSTAKK